MNRAGNAASTWAARRDDRLEPAEKTETWGAHPGYPLASTAYALPLRRSSEDRNAILHEPNDLLSDVIGGVSR